jgi:DNA polymerase-3 subunit beta
MNALAIIAAPVSTASLDYSVFKKAMLNACKVVEKKSTIPVLNTVLITSNRKGVNVIGTDMDLYSTTLVAGKADTGFLAIVDAHKLKGIMDKVKDAANINFTLDGDSLAVSIGKLKLTLKQEHERSEFPEDAAFRTALGKSNVSFMVPAATLLKAMSKIQLAISTEETRYYLNGVFMHLTHDNRLAFVATDGHRLARFEIPAPAGAEATENGVIIPRKTVGELLRLLKRKECPSDIMVSVADNGVSFLIGEDELLESKVVDGTFPDYLRVIPTRNEHKVPVRTAAFIDALKQASSISAEKSRSSKLTLTPGEIAVTCYDPDFGHASTEITVDHDVTLEIGFNAGYLLEILAQLDGGAMLELGGPGDPAIVKDGADDDVTYVMMPMRV